MGDGPHLGLPTVHVAQSELGLARQHLIRHVLHAWIRKGDSVSRWRPQELPGCAAGAGANKFYEIYRADHNLIEGKFATADAYLVPSARLALSQELKILKKRPTFVDCGRAECLSCGLRLYQPWRIPRTLYLNWFKKELSASRP